MRRFTSSTLLLLTAMLVSLPAFAQDVITTAIGGGPNGIPAINANLYNPYGVAADTSGNFYIASFRFAWSFGRRESSRIVSASYFIDLIPAALSTDMPEYRWTTRCRPDTLCPSATPIPHDVYGFGFAPIGWAVAIGRGPASDRSLRVRKPYFIGPDGRPNNAR